MHIRKGIEGMRNRGNQHGLESVLLVARVECLELIISREPACIISGCVVPFFSAGIALVLSFKMPK